MLETIDDLIAAGYRRVHFPDGNKVRYSMDFSFWETLPSDRDFFVVTDEPFRRDGWVTLKACGYGVRGDYGNGSVLIKIDQVPISAPEKAAG